MQPEKHNTCVFICKVIIHALLYQYNMLSVQDTEITKVRRRRLSRKRKRIDKDTIKIVFTKVRGRSVTSLSVVNLRLHTGTLNFTIKTNNR